MLGVIRLEVHLTKMRIAEECTVTDHILQLPVLLFIGMMASFSLVLLGCSVEDALRRR